MVSETLLTQVGRALKQLGIEHIAAYSPEARGRSASRASASRNRSPWRCGVGAGQVALSSPSSVVAGRLDSAVADGTDQLPASDTPFALAIASDSAGTNFSPCPAPVAVAKELRTTALTGLATPALTAKLAR